MKTFLSIGFSLLVAASTFAQGQIEFRVLLDGNHAIPPTSGYFPAEGSFTLFSDNQFGGSVGFIVIATSPGAVQVQSVTLYRSSTQGELGTPLYTFTKGTLEIGDATAGIPWVQNYDLSGTLSPQEVSDLYAGRLWVNATADGYADGILRGQIVLVPEPSSLVLIAPGIGALLLGHRRAKGSGRVEKIAVKYSH